MSGMPITAKEALELWDSGVDIPAFAVESEGALQDAIYAMAFEMLRAELGEKGQGVGYILKPREFDAAKSIAHVAKLKGWAAMVQQHVAGGHIAAILVRKPK